MADADPEFRVAVALRDALPTRRHGQMLFDMVAEHPGASFRMEAAPDGSQRTLYRLAGDDPRWVLPWPLLTIDRNPRRTLHMDIPGLKTVPPPPPRPGKAPNLRDLGPGFVEIRDGVRHIQVHYASDGRWFECNRGGPPNTLESVLPVLAAGGGPVVERLAEWAVGLDLARHGPLRVFLPVPDAGCAQAVWGRGLSSVRQAFGAGRIPPGARWVAADPVDGTALSWGATRDEALFAWSAEVERVRPGSKRPPRPPRPSFEPPREPELPGREEEGDEPPLKITGEAEDLGGGHLGLRMGVHFREPDPDEPLPPPPPPGSVPAVLLSLDEPPAVPPPGGRWLRFLGGAGATVAAALREEPAGWSLVGARVEEALGGPGAEAAMDEADRAHDLRMAERGGGPAPSRPETPWSIRVYRILDESTGGPRPEVDPAGYLLRDRSVPVFDGDALVFGGARLRRTGG